MLPNPGVIFLILIERLHRGDQEPTAPIRPQAQIRFIQQPCRCVTSKPGIDALTQSGVDFRGIGMNVVIDKNDVEVRCVAEFLTAELAVADDCESWLSPVLSSQS